MTPEKTRATLEKLGKYLGVDFLAQIDKNLHKESRDKKTVDAMSSKIIKYEKDSKSS